MARTEPRFLQYTTFFFFALLTSLVSCLPNSALPSDAAFSTNNHNNSTILDTTTTTTNPAAIHAPLSSDQKITCYPIQQLPSDFHCHDALQQALRDLEAREGTIYHLTHLPIIPSLQRRTTLRVPHTWRSGSCDIVLTTVRRLPDVRVYASLLRTWAQRLIEACVMDESHTGGGLLRVDFERGTVFRGNSLTFEAKLRPYSGSGSNSNVGTDDSGDDGGGEGGDDDGESPGITLVGSGSIVPSS